MSKTCLQKRTVEIIYKVLPTEYTHLEEMVAKLKEYNINMSAEAVRGVYRKLVEINLVKGKKGEGYKRVGLPDADVSSIIANGTHIEKHAPDRAKRIYHEVSLILEVAATNGRYIPSSQIKKRVDAKSPEITWALRKLQREGLIAPKKSRGYTWVGPIKTRGPQENPMQMTLDVPPEEAKKMIEEMDNAKPGTIVPVEELRELPFPFNYKIYHEGVGNYKLSLTPPHVEHERRSGVCDDKMSTVVITNRYGQEIDRVTGSYVHVSYVDLQKDRQWTFGEKMEKEEEKGEKEAERKKGFFARLFGF